jgi:hypothetical protein
MLGMRCKYVLHGLPLVDEFDVFPNGLPVDHVISLPAFKLGALARRH